MIEMDTRISLLESGWKSYCDYKILIETKPELLDLDVGGSGFDNYVEGELEILFWRLDDPVLELRWSSFVSLFIHLLLHK